MNKEIIIGLILFFIGIILVPIGFYTGIYGSSFGMGITWTFSLIPAGITIWVFGVIYLVKGTQKNDRKNTVFQHLFIPLFLELIFITIIR